ncbi:FIG003033: Helicase domain protein [hydrothermal vent metagenome]|uniref:FIG003033: Helicase domain protein n=1 Tax=hydrothermal vent metagenome TaxID=652676 RepID=A0A3B0VU15_9ZZZZ
MSPFYDTSKNDLTGYEDFFPTLQPQSLPCKHAMKKNISNLIKGLKGRKDLREVVHHEELRAVEPVYGALKRPLPCALLKNLTSLGRGKLYSHQADAINLIREDKHTVVMTPTASGKSLIYNIPVIEAVLNDPGARALYIFPLKSLTQDQLKGIKDFTKGITEGLDHKNIAAIYDGDTTDYRRKKIRENPPHILLTNPDMLHLGICAFHQSWAEFFKGLRYIVLDELHTYRGVLGSHVAQLIRRLRRIARLYGADPIFITCSATIANPIELAQRLTGLPFEAVTESGAPQGRRNFLFIDPEEGQSPYSIATKVFCESVEQGFKTIAFTKSRKITELIYRWAVQGRPELTKVVSSYRSGFLPEERREIEARLFSGELHGVISTSALELGVDIGGLDVCILIGYPGTISSTWQRAGRVGRQGRESLIIMIAIEDALDKYFMRHPTDFFRRSVEAATLDTTNLPILEAHLPCALSEVPMDRTEDVFDTEEIAPALTSLAREKRVLHLPGKDTWITRSRHPHRGVSIRGTGSAFRIIADDKTLLGETDSTRVMKELHPGAIYLHRGLQYKVTGLHLGDKEVFCREVDLNYYTTPLSDEDTEILSIDEEKAVGSGGLVISRGTLRTTETVLGYMKKDINTRKVIDEVYLDLPAHVFTTKGVWTTVDEDILEDAKEQGFDCAGGMHALEHAQIAALPLFAICDRNDLGGVSYFPVNPDLEQPAIFIYDGVEGGIGLTKRGFEMTEQWFEATLTLMEDCPCEVSCPSCTQDPHCGNNNEPLDKRTAIMVLRKWLGR